jgi:hypothetical protein
MTLTLRARVRGGRLVLDEPIDLPEGSEVELVMADQQDGLDDEQRAKLHAALARSIAKHRPGEGTPAATVLSELRERR